MRASHRPSPPAPVSDPPCRFIAGDVSLDFVNTVDWTRRGLAQERLSEFPKLVEWGRATGLLDDRTARRLHRAGGEHPRRAAATIRSAHRLRQILRRVYVALARGEPALAGLRALNAAIPAAFQNLSLAEEPAASRKGHAVRRRSAAPATRLDQALSPVVWAAIDLLLSEEVTKLRICPGADCGWLYLDRSRNGLRRWCEMATCGTREKSRRRAERKARRIKGQEKDGKQRTARTRRVPDYSTVTDFARLRG